VILANNRSVTEKNRNQWRIKTSHKGPTGQVLRDFTISTSSTGLVARQVVVQPSP